MPPNSVAREEPIPLTEYKIPKHNTKIIWINVLVLLGLHVILLYAFYLCFTIAYWQTSIFAYLYGYFGGIGVTAGAHRLWAHRSYKAKLPLRVFLCCLNSIAGQKDILNWCRDHRVHHKFSETDADPHNIKRGFFFAHVGWLMCKKHPDVTQKGKTVLLDDLLADPVIRFHARFYYPMFIFFSFIVPITIPVWFWGETLSNSFFIAGLGKYCLLQNMTWLVNSAAHKYGDKPFDKYMEARENAIVAFFAQGEGWHNYHHTFPWDYSTSELGYTLNSTKLFIDFMALIGQAYDLKSVHPDMVKNRKLKTGDGSRMKEIYER